jgi:ABC-type dipeptide/oligopeptide/nickel transport system permease component
VRQIIRRILFYIFAVWIAITIDFFIPRLAPGDPVAGLVGKMSTQGYVTPEMQQVLASQFGLNTHDPLWLQYLKYLDNLLHGNLGNSIQYFPTPPGIGYALLQAVNQQDYAMIQAIFLIITLAVLGATSWRVRWRALVVVHSPRSLYCHVGSWTCVDQFWH